MFQLVSVKVVRQIDQATVRVERRYLYKVAGKILKGRRHMLCQVPKGVNLEVDQEVTLEKVAPVSKLKHFLARPLAVQ